MNVVLKIEALAASPASLIDPVTGIEFLVVGQTDSHLQLVAECPRCPSGIIEHDLPVADIATPWGPALCERCEDEPVELSLQAPPMLEVRFPIPAPRPPSLVNSVAGKLPVPRFEDTRPVYTPKPTPQCRDCGRYLCQDNSSGIMPVRCGVCLDARANKTGKPKAEHVCRQCSCSLEFSHSSRIYCDSCVRGRAWIQQKNQSAKRLKERRAARLCQRCKTEPLGVNAHAATKYCPDCRDAAYREASKRQMDRYHSKKQQQKEMKA